MNEATTIELLLYEYDETMVKFGVLGSRHGIAGDDLQPLCFEYGVLAQKRGNDLQGRNVGGLFTC